jgi:hypothetical protein
MTKEEFLALGVQANDVVLVNDEYVGFVVYIFGSDDDLGLTVSIKRYIEEVYPIYKFSDIKKVKVIGRVE